MGIQEEEVRTTTYCLFLNLCFDYYIFFLLFATLFFNGWIIPLQNFVVFKNQP